MRSNPGVWLTGVWFAIAAHSGPVNYIYANWTSDTLEVASPATPGSASGTLPTLGGVTVTYSRDLVNATQVNNTGTDYYSGFNSVYTNSVVANMPDNVTTGNVDVISLQENPTFTNTLTFSTPLLNPIMDLISLGGGAPVVYNFSATPSLPANDVLLLSQGAAFFGGCGTCLTMGNNSISGSEGDGVLEFVGSFSSISWTTTGSEYWNGFQIGVAGLGAVPEPSTWMSLMAGGALLAPFAWRRRKR